MLCMGLLLICSSSVVRVLLLVVCVVGWVIVFEWYSRLVFD